METDFPTIDTLRTQLETNPYLTLSTCSKDNIPHITPVYIGHRTSQLKFYWLSAENSQHSRNIKDNPIICAVHFNTNATPGTGIGIYLSGPAHQLSPDKVPFTADGRDEFSYAIDVLTQNRPDLDRNALLSPDAPRKPYVFYPTKAWCNGAVLKDECWVDAQKPLQIDCDGFRRTLSF